MGESKPNFDDVDKNKDGHISKAEFEEAKASGEVASSSTTLAVTKDSIQKEAKEAKDEIQQTYSEVKAEIADLRTQAQEANKEFSELREAAKSIKDMLGLLSK